MMRALMPTRLDRLRARLTSPRVPLVAAALAALLILPAVPQGLQVDDHWHRFFLVGSTRWAAARKPTLQLFTFFDGDPARNHWFMDQGAVAWWTDTTVNLSFFRPLAALTHALDYRLWPNSTALMHLHSIAWYAALAALAALLYRRLLGAGWIAGLAAVLYAIDHTHGQVVAWIANRNAIMTAALGLLTILLHDRARKARSPASAALAALALLLALFSGEAAVGALGYLAAYALFLDEARPRDRVRALLPYAPALLLWFIPYRAGHYGARGSGMYLDPLNAPLQFLANLPRHLPLLLGAEFGAPVPDVYPFVPPAAQLAMVIVFCLFLLLALLALTPLLRRDARARFFAAGALLAALPSCALPPAARLLLLPSFGLIGLVAMGTAAVLDRADWLPAQRPRRLPAIVFAAWVGGGHLVLSPLLIHITTQQMAMFEGAISGFADSLGDDPKLTRQRLIVVNAPDGAFTGYVSVNRSTYDRPVPAALLSLAVGTRPIELERRDDHSVIVRSPGGFYQRATDLLTRNPQLPMPVGTRVTLTGVTVEVTHTTAKGTPDEALFHFDAPLDSDSLRWVQWQGRAFVPFTLPPVGALLRIEPQTVQL